MPLKIDPKAESAEILNLFGVYLRDAVTEVDRLVEILQALTTVEWRLKYEKEHLNDKVLPQGLRQETIYALEHECTSIACEAKAVLNVVVEKFSPPPRELTVVVQRLDEKYGDAFKKRNLLRA